MWSVTRIDEADYGCEERMPGEPLLVLVTIESDDGRMCRFECAENWLLQQGIDEGDEWPEDIEQVEADREQIDHVSGARHTRMRTRSHLTLRMKTCL